MKKTIQAKHVPEIPMLRFIESNNGSWKTHFDTDSPQGIGWSIPASIPEMRAFPERVLLAKLSSLLRRGLVDGCDCGCRGDWRPTARTRAYVEKLELKAERKGEKAMTEQLKEAIKEAAKKLKTDAEGWVPSSAPYYDGPLEDLTKEQEEEIYARILLARASGERES